MKAARADLKVKEGAVVRSGLLGWVAGLATLSIKAQITLASVIVAIAYDRIGP